MNESNEPTVLDFIKSIFKSWSSFTSFARRISQRKETDVTEPENISPDSVTATDVAAVAMVKEPTTVSWNQFPWRVLLVLVLSLAGQKMFEPPQQLYYLGIIFYISALGIMLFGIRRKEWELTSLPGDDAGKDSFSVRAVAFVISLIAGAVTFYYMTGNRFTAFNLTLWAITIVSHFYAFWERKPEGEPSVFQRVRDLFSHKEWTLRVTWLGLFAVLVIVVSIFFRTHRLETVAPEMTSDHAEKLLDVYDITQGMYSIYFPRNTGREPLYVYLCALFSRWFGLSFLTLKVVASIGGLVTLVFIYLLGKEFGSPRIGLLAAAFAGFGYWPTVIERFGLRISFYPLFSAITLYFFIRALRRQRRNDFILAGVGLGLGLNGYTPFRIMPFVLVALFAVYFFFYIRDNRSRLQMIAWFTLMALTAWIFFIPLARYWMENPDMFAMRAFSRIGTTERAFPGSVLLIFLSNLWNSAKQFNWYNGNIWVHSVPGRPALDVVSGALFLIGVALVVIRFIRNRNWRDILIFLAIPLLQMPSTLSLAFPDENPSLNRTGGAYVPVFLLVGFGLDSLLNSFAAKRETSETSSETEVKPLAPNPLHSYLVGIVLVGMFIASFAQNYDLIFNQYYNEYRGSAWNSRDMASVITEFVDEDGSYDNAWIVPYPYWVDTRLEAFWAGIAPRDFAIDPNQLASTAPIQGAKLFLFHTQDQNTLSTLRQLYPNGMLTLFKSGLDGKDFYVFRVPAQ